MLALVKKPTELGKIVFPQEASLQHYDPAFEQTASMKAASVSLQNTTSKAQEGLLLYKNRSPEQTISLSCSSHKPGSQHTLLSEESWFGRNSFQSVHRLMVLFH